MNNQEKRRLVEQNLRTGYHTLKYRHVHKHGRKASSCITYEQFVDIVSQPCVHCGCPPSIPIKAPDGSVIGAKNSVDRISSRGAYTKRNVQPSCLMCNAAKQKLEDAAFWDLAKRITTYQEAKEKNEWPNCTK